MKWKYRLCKDYRVTTLSKIINGIMQSLKSIEQFWHDKINCYIHPFICAAKKTSAGIETWLDAWAKTNGVTLLMICFLQVCVIQGQIYLKTKNVLWKWFLGTLTYFNFRQIKFPTTKNYGGWYIFLFLFPVRLYLAHIIIPRGYSNLNLINPNQNKHEKHISINIRYTVNPSPEILQPGSKVTPFNLAW